MKGLLSLISVLVDHLTLLLESKADRVDILFDLGLSYLYFSLAALHFLFGFVYQKSNLDIELVKLRH